MQKATVWKKKRRPPAAKTTHMVEEPAYTNDELFRFLGVDPETIKQAKEAAEIQQHIITDDMWATLELDKEWDVEEE